MSRKKSKAFPEGNSSAPQDTSGLGGITVEELRRIMSEAIDKSFDKGTSHFGLKLEYPKNTNQRLAGLEHGARQPRLATEADLEADKMNRKRTEGAAAADRAKHIWDTYFARRVDDDPTSLTIFDKIAELPMAPEKCIGDALVNKGAKPHLPPVEVRMLSSATGGLLPAGTASIAIRTILRPPSLRNFCPTEEMDFRTTTSIQLYATYSSFRQIKALEMKSRQTLVLGPGSFTGRLRTCQFLGGWHALICG